MSGALIAVFQNQRGFATVADAPGIGTATATSDTTATVAYTAPANDGGATITSYVATSTPGSITGTLSTAASGTITVSGLTAATAYTFTVRAVNSVGNSAESSASNSITTQAAPGQQVWTSGTGNYWTCPAGVSSVSVLCIAIPRNGELSYTGGPPYSYNGFGGCLSYINNYSVTPSSTYLVYLAGHNTFFVNESTIRANAQSTRVGDGGGDGGTNSYLSGVLTRQGGSGGGGYSGNGGTGNTNSAGAAGAGGGAGAGSGSGGRGGGGVGNQGEGSSGAASASGYQGSGGSGTGNTAYAGTAGSSGKVRIMWPGDARQYPSTRTADE